MKDTKLSRRTAIAAAVATAAAPATAAAVPASGTKDAELLQLGRQFDAALSPWLEQMRIDRERYTKFRHAVLNATGINHQDIEGLYVLNDDGRMLLNPDPAVQAYWDTWDRLWRENVRDIPDGYLDAIAEPIDELVTQMMQLKPMTIAGLGVWARAIMFFHAGLWHKDPDIRYGDDSSEECLRALVEACAALAGVCPPAEITSPWNWA